MAISSARDLSTLADLFASSRFDRAECLARLSALDRAERELPSHAHEQIEAVRGPVQAVGAARRAEGRTPESIRAVLRALAEGDVGSTSVRSSLLFDALFGASGRNAYFDVPRALSHSVPSGLAAQDRWHELVVALETGDEGAMRVVLDHLAAHASMPRWEAAGNHGYQHRQWELAKRHAKIDSAPPDAQVRWVLDRCATRTTGWAARGLALSLGIEVPQDAHNEYSVGAVVSLVAQLPVGFPDWDALFELTILELKEAHIGTTIGDSLAVIPWDAIADERDGDTLTLRRSFRGHEVKWTHKLWRIGEGTANVHEDLKGRLASKRVSRALAPGVSWPALLDRAEQCEFLTRALACGDVFAVRELLAAGVPITAEQVPTYASTAMLRAMAPSLDPAVAASLFARRLDARRALALIDRTTPTDAQWVELARRGATAVFEAEYTRLSPGLREACSAAAEAGHAEGTADVLRKGPPAAFVAPRLEVRLVTAEPAGAKKAATKKPKRPAPIELPIEPTLTPIAVAVSADRIQLSTTAGDVVFERADDAWSRVPTTLRSQGLARGDGFTMVQAYDASANRWDWQPSIDGAAPEPRRGPGATHPCWSAMSVWAAAGGRRVVAGTFEHGAQVFVMSESGELSAPVALCPDKVSGLATDGHTVLVRRPACVEAYEPDAQGGFRRTFESSFSPDAWAVSGDRLVLGKMFAPSKHGSGVVYVFRRSADGWSLEREVIAPKPKVEGFGTMVAFWRDTLVVSSGTKQGARWMFPDVASEEAVALPSAALTRWSIGAGLFVDAHRGKAKDAPLELTVHPLG